MLLRRPLAFFFFGCFFLAHSLEPGAHPVRVSPVEVLESHVEGDDAGYGCRDDGQVFKLSVVRVASSPDVDGDGLVDEGHQPSGYAAAAYVAYVSLEAFGALGVRRDSPRRSDSALVARVADEAFALDDRFQMPEAGIVGERNLIILGFADSRAAGILACTTAALVRTHAREKAATILASGREEITRSMSTSASMVCMTECRVSDIFTFFPENTVGDCVSCAVNA